MAHGDRDFLGRMTLQLLALGGIAVCVNYYIFLGKRRRSRVSIWSKAGQFMKHLVPFKVHDAKEDYFGQLSDDELSNVLGHLSLGNPARTSSLSIPSMAIPELGFNCLDMFDIDDHSCCPRYQQKFLKGVDQVLQLYSGREVAHVKVTCCFGREFPSEFDQYMHSLSRLRVERLSFYFCCSSSPSTALFSCNPIRDPGKLFKFSLDLLPQTSSLKHLFLYYCAVQPSFSVRLDSLSTLDLMFVSLESKQLEGIFSSCLNLDKLQLEHCKLPRKLCICGTTTSVIIKYCGGLEEIDFQAANLRRFECLFLGEVRLHFSDVPVLEHVMIQFLGDASLPYIFGDFTRDLPAQVKSLTVTTSTSQIRYFPTEPQTFRSLTKLSLVLLNTHDSDIVSISPLLGACPLLQYLDLVQGRTDWKKGKVVAPLSPTHHTELKKVTFGGFNGTGAEIEFVVYILRSAAALEVMFLSPCYSCNSGCGGRRAERRSHVSLDERKRNLIQGELNGQAISRNAEVIIQ